MNSKEFSIVDLNIEYRLTNNDFRSTSRFVDQCSVFDIQKTIIVVQ